MEFGAQNEINLFLVNHTFMCSFLCNSVKTELPWISRILQRLKIIFSASSYLLWSIFSLRCHHPLHAGEMPKSDSERAQAHRSKLLPSPQRTVSHILRPETLYEWHNDVIVGSFSDQFKSLLWYHSSHQKSEAGWIQVVPFYHMQLPLIMEHMFSLELHWNTYMMKCRQGTIFSTLKF